MGGAINNYARFESMQKGLETFFQDADKGKQKFEELRKLSNTTTFGVDELARSFTELANVGVNVDTINDKLVMLGNIAGGDKNKFADLVSIYAKINSTGKAGSMQIQQLAQRGVPIYDMLKKIGIQGSATATDITKAFREMTKEGGQFYNAMDNINSTIEGKEGFISDYFKEFTVNFAEITGIADAYKAVLDMLKEVIGSISDKLLEWNQNPVMKAIIQGTFVALITAIGGVIATSIIPLLAKIIGQLVTINILSGPAGWAVLAVAGIAGVTTALIGANKQMKNLAESTKTATDEIKNMSTIDIREDFVKEYEEIKKGLEEQLEEIEKQKKKIKPKTNIWTGAVNRKGMDEYLAKMTVFEEQENILKAKIAGVSEAIDFNKGKVKALKDEIQEAIDTTEQFNATLNNMKSAFAKSRQGKEADLLKQIEEYQKLLKPQKGYKDNQFITLGLTEEEAKQTKKVISDLQKELRKLNPIENLKYQNEILDAYNAQGNSLDNLIDKTYELKTLEMDLTEEEKKKYIELLKQNEIKDRLAKKRQGVVEKYTDLNYRNGESDKVTSAMATPEYQNSSLQEQQAIIYGIMNGISTQEAKQLLTLEKEVAVKEKIVESVVAMQNALDNFDIQGFLESMQSYFGERLKNGDNSAIGGYAASNMANRAISASADASDAMTGMQQGGPWGAVINVVLGAFMRVASTMEGFEEVMNPVTMWMQELAPIIKVIIDVTKEINEIFSLLFRIIGTLAPVVQMIFNTLKPIVNIIKLIISGLGIVLKVIIPLIKMLGEAIEWVVNTITFGLLDSLEDAANSAYEFADVTKEEAENREKLLESLKSLTQAMKEQEAEYIRRKKELNSATYASDVTNVHDMILTPQGRFSTDPDDYIIASKNPSELGKGGSANVSIVVNNTISQTANVEVKRNRDGDTEKFIIQISQKVAQDYASGTNGWDSAYAYKQQSQNGRRLGL